MKKMIGGKMADEYKAIIDAAIKMDLGDNASQILRKSLREFAQNHGIEVKKND